ncbi:Trk system potassium transporter TrkA [Psittacicella hinzii]|uniref:Trk system potassium uptake protein TrkA n=1 Tax=Psittacicella hinzii TaxID=2028575 RepID=A0A3A1YRI8_9GAMM|nr:Trk system potassium transporter TrkA [Psittacicella hinzii]RIY38637.1 Trk system potassium transport protein TrkA [Psittacicella hinzii]
MRIVILGAGKVGTSIIDNFIDDECDLVVVDTDSDLLAAIAAKYDLVTITGHATDLDTLDRADLKSADILVAATQHDEINILACKIAHEIYNVECKIARLRDRKYLNHQDRLIGQNLFPIDYVVEPTLIVANAINNLIRYPGVEYFTYFCDQEVAAFACQAQYGGSFVGRVATQAAAELIKLNISLVGIIRNSVIISINDFTIINAGDTIVLMAEPDNVMLAIGYFQRALAKPRRIMLAGGSRVNTYLAGFLRSKASVKLIEQQSDKALELANNMANVLVIAGDCSDENLLFEEKIDSTDIYVAATGQDNLNILTAVLAKRMGCKRAIAVIGKSVNRSLIHNEEIDIIYSGQNDLATELRAHGMASTFKRVYRDPNNIYSLFQCKLHGYIGNKPISGIEYGQLKLPHNIRFVGLMRKGLFQVVTSHTQFLPDDKVLGISYTREDLQAFAKLIQKSPTQI